jgi:cytochrome P450
VFADARRVDFTRRPNRHVAFGAGVHRCPGAALARLELHAALTVWHRRIPEYRLAGDPSFYELPSIRRFVHLPLAWA